MGRVTLASRVFGMAAILGLALVSGEPQVMLSLIVIATVSSTAAYVSHATPLASALVVTVEAGITGLVIGLALPGAAIFLPYLVILTLIAGILRGVRGPANPTMNDVAGLLVDGFDRQPSILMPYNKPYHKDYLERYGFARAMTMWAYYVHKKYVRTDKMARGVELVKRRNPGIRLRALDMKRFDEEADAVLDIYNDAWSRNWGHVPMTKNEFKKLAKDMKQIVDPRMVFLLEDGERPVGFSISLPNLNLALRHVKDGRLLPMGLPKLLAYSSFGGIYEVRMPLMGVRQAYQGRGLDAILVYETIVQGPRIGYDACEMSWVLDVNHVLRNSLDSMGGVVDKEYAMFEKSIA